MFTECPAAGSALSDMKVDVTDERLRVLEIRSDKQIKHGCEGYL
jgi:hypothetical protein